MSSAATCTNVVSPIAYAAKNGSQISKQRNKQRAQMSALLKPLANELGEEKHDAIAKCNPMVAKVLARNGFARHMPLQRELAFIFGVPDWVPYHH